MWATLCCKEVIKESEVSMNRVQRLKIVVYALKFLLDNSMISRDYALKVREVLTWYEQMLKWEYHK